MINNIFIIVFLIFGIGLISCTPREKIVIKKEYVTVHEPVKEFVQIDVIVFPNMVFPNPVVINQLIFDEKNIIFVKKDNKYLFQLKNEPFMTLDPKTKKKNKCLPEDQFDLIVAGNYAYINYLMDINSFMINYSAYLKEYEISKEKIKKENDENVAKAKKAIDSHNNEIYKLLEKKNE